MLRSKLNIFVILLMVISMPVFAAAPKKEEAPPPPPNPDVIWLKPIKVLVTTKYSRPRTWDLHVKINLMPEKFDTVCPLVPEITDALILELNKNLFDAETLKGKDKGSFFLKTTKFIKNKFNLKKDIYSVEIYKETPTMDKDAKMFHNKCNILPPKEI